MASLTDFRWKKEKWSKFMEHASSTGGSLRPLTLKSKIPMTFIASGLVSQPEPHRSSPNETEAACTSTLSPAPSRWLSTKRRMERPGSALQRMRRCRLAGDANQYDSLRPGFVKCAETFFKLSTFEQKIGLGDAVGAAVICCFKSTKGTFTP